MILPPKRPGRMELCNYITYLVPTLWLILRQRILPLCNPGTNTTILGINLLASSHKCTRIFAGLVLGHRINVRIIQTSALLQ